LTYREPNRSYWGARAGWGAPVALVLLAYSSELYRLLADAERSASADYPIGLAILTVVSLPFLLLFGTLMLRRRRLEVTADRITLPYRARDRRGRVVTQIRVEDVSKAEMVEGFDPVPSSLQGIYDATRASDPDTWRCELTLNDGTLVSLDYAQRACKPIDCRDALARFVDNVWARRS